YTVNPLGAPILAIRTRIDAASLAAELSARVRTIDPTMPAYNVTVMETLVARSTAQRRFLMLVLTAFAFAALLVAGVGIYGLMAHNASKRTAEIGLRMALGAAPEEVLKMVLREGSRLFAAGLAAGFLAALSLAWLMRGMLFAMGPLDPVAFGAAALTLAVF